MGGKIVSKKASANGKGLRPDQGLDRGRDEGAEVPEREGLRRREEGHAPVQEGEGVLRPVSAKRDDAWRRGRSQLLDVGLSRILLSDGHFSCDSAIIRSVYANS